MTTVSSLAVGSDDMAYVVGAIGNGTTYVASVTAQGTVSTVLGSAPTPQSIAATADGSLWIGRSTIEPSGICDCEVDVFQRPGAVVPPRAP